MARQKNYIVYYVWLMMSMTVAAVVAEGRFEDADKSNDFLSQTSHHYFDLRHTIPGEPNIDYPIYGEVPRTSFSCSNKHEGYYADIESRCQAFRICTHTAQNTAGFGFLCPNGTLFSQRHFVCDWYRNVRCEESELFYDKNRLNHVGNNYEMMEKVRQMIEHPMKTISKALQQHTYNNNSPRITHTSQQTAKTSYYASSLNSQNVQNEKKSSSGSVTSTDSGQYYSTKIQKTSRPQKVLQNGDIKSFALSNEAHKDVYVNSLGELSTDPSAKFDAKTARIIAHPKKATGRNLNFAQSINFGLNDHRSGSSVNQLKNTRGTKDESTLDANFNILRHEIIAELDTKVSGYQPQLTGDDKNFQFLSRGFSTSGDNKTKIKSKNSYQYQPPKQTPNTVRFSHNAITQDSLIKHKQNTQDSGDNDDIEFKFMTTTEENAPGVDSLFINSELFDLGSLTFDLGPDNMEMSSTNDEQSEMETPTITTTTPSTTTILTSTSTTTPSTTSSLPLLSLELEAPPPTPEDILLNSLNLDDLVQVLSDRKRQQQNDAIEENSTKVMASDETEEKINVNRHAEDLFISGIQLAENILEYNDVNKNVSTNLNEQNSTTTTTESITTPVPTTTQAPTTTTTTEKAIIKMQISKSEMVTEVNMIENRVRSRRRFVKTRKIEGRSTTTTTPSPPTTTSSTSIRPRHLRRYTRRNEISNSTPKTIEKTRTTTRTPAPNKRQRKQRTTTTTKQPSLDSVVELSGNNERRNIRARNINSKSNRINNFNVEIEKSTRYNQRRRTTTKLPITNTTTTTPSTTSSSTTKTTTPSTTTEIMPSNSSVASISSISSNFTSINNSTAIIITQNATQLFEQDEHDERENVNFLPFNELTRSILDKSILQNYRNSQHVGHHPQVQTSSSYVPPPTIATKLSTTTIKANPITNKNTAQTTYSPSILIARAEGKRILTNPLSNLPIAQHFQEQHSQQQQQQQKKTPYVPLNDFLSGRFGAGEITKNVHGSQQQEQKYYPQYQPVQRQEQQNPFLSHQQPQPQQQHLQQQQQPQQQHQQQPKQHQQHPQQQQPPQQQPQQKQPQQHQQHPQQQQPQIKLPLNPFLSHHNHQHQQQQPQQQSYYSQPQQQQPQLQSYYNQPQQQQQPYSAFINSNFNNHGNSNQINQLVQNNANQRPNSFLNVKLPTLSDGLIPVPSVPYIPQNAQRRKDTFNLDLETTQGPRPKNIFMGASSYEVPLSSVGRLPNDVQRLRKKI